MLVQAKKDLQDYGPITRIIKGGLYIVYAIEIEGEKTNLFVLPAKYEVEEGRQPDPLFFPADIFDIVEDRVSGTWNTASVTISDESKVYRSFPEWFENNFYRRGHDWDFEDDDYVIMKRYILEYEHIYSDLLSHAKTVEVNN